MLGAHKMVNGYQVIRKSGCRLLGKQGIRSKNGGQKTEKEGISNIEQGILNDEGRRETEDPRQRNREACTGGKLQGRVTELVNWRLEI